MTFFSHTEQIRVSHSCTTNISTNHHFCIELNLAQPASPKDPGGSLDLFTEVWFEFDLFWLLRISDLRTWLVGCCGKEGMDPGARLNPLCVPRTVVFLKWLDGWAGRECLVVGFNIWGGAKKRTYFEVACTCRAWVRGLWRRYNWWCSELRRRRCGAVEFVCKFQLQHRSMVHVLLCYAINSMINWYVCYSGRSSTIVALSVSLKASILHVPL